MGHVVNPISYRLNTTATSPFILHNQSLSLYSLIYQKISFAYSYVFKLINMQRVREFFLLSNIKLIVKYNSLFINIFFYSSILFHTLLDYKQVLLRVKKKKRMVGFFNLSL